MLTREENKTLNHRERAEGLTTLRSLPLVAKIEVTTRCNLRCVMCAINTSDRARADLSMDTFLKLKPVFPTLLSAYLYGVGEPLLHPDILEMFRHLTDAGVNAGIITNGLLLTEPVIAELVERKLYKIAISVDSLTPAVYERIRRGASFERLMTNIRLVNEHKKRAGSDATRLVFNVVMMRDTLNELVPLIERAHELGVSEVVINDLLVFNDAMKGQVVSYDDPALARVYDDAEVRANKYGIHLAIPHTFRSWQRACTDARSPLTPQSAEQTADHGMKDFESFKPCTEPWSGFWMTQEGGITPCCYWFKKMGSLGEARFAEIWNNEHYRELRTTVNTVDRPHLCRRCPIP